MYIKEEQCGAELMYSVPIVRSGASSTTCMRGGTRFSAWSSFSVVSGSLRRLSARSSMPICTRKIVGCKYNPPHTSTHHIYWPRHWYTTPLEKRFRQHPDNVVHGLCRCMHDLEHLKKPPKKPSEAQMRAFLNERRWVQSPVPFAVSRWPTRQATYTPVSFVTSPPLTTSSNGAPARSYLFLHNSLRFPFLPKVESR